MPLAEDTPRAQSSTAAPVDAGTAKAYWRSTSTLMWIMLGIWFFASFFVHLFARELNTIRILGFPLGFYMAAQGSLIIFVVMLFWFARKQDSIDEKFGVAEE